VLGRQQDGPAPLPAEPEPLDEAQHREQDSGGHPHGRVAREAADKERGQPHQEQREDQHRLPPHPVPEMPEDDPAYGPGHEGDGEARVGKKLRHPAPRQPLRHEDRRERERGGRPVNVEVVELDGRPDKARKRHPAHRGLPGTLPHRLLRAAPPKPLPRPTVPKAAQALEAREERHRHNR
jgi:hypothetical protein